LLSCPEKVEEGLEELERDQPQNRLLPTLRKMLARPAKERPSAAECVEDVNALLGTVLSNEAALPKDSIEGDGTGGDKWPSSFDREVDKLFDGASNQQTHSKARDRGSFTPGYAKSDGAENSPNRTTAP
jgi:hypothetical protein